MAHKVEVVKNTVINGKEVKKGDTLSLGGALYKKLKAEKTVKDTTVKKQAKEKQMAARDLMDSTRSSWVDSDSAPTREVMYTRTSDDFAYPPLNSFVGGGKFNEEEKDKLEEHQSFGGLKLTEKPQVNDTVLYDGELFKVQRYMKFGELYQVFGRKSRHSGRPSKR